MRVQVGDVGLFVDVEGAALVPDGSIMHERPTVLLVHGGPGFDHSHLKPFYSRLADFAQVIFFDQRGTGLSDASTPDRWTLDQWVDDLDGLCRALGIVQPTVIGVSAGGFIAMAYAARYPEGLGKMILSGTAANMRLDRMLPMFEHLGGAEARKIAEQFWSRADDPERLAAYMETCFPLYYQTDQGPEWLDRAIVNTDMLGHFYGPEGEGFEFNLLPELPNVQCQTLVLAGEHDPVTPATQAADIAAALPAGLVRYVCYDHCGHTPERDDPDAVYGLMREFILDDGL